MTRSLRRTGRPAPSTAAFAAFAALLAVACGGAEASSALESFVDDDGNAGVRAEWSYESASVDVDISVVTIGEPGGAACTTVAKLHVNDAVSAPENYRFDTTCDVLRITQDGDLVLHDEPTGHDWSAEPIDVDTDRERIDLGPWESPDGTVYRFFLASPGCGACECPKLTRRAGDVQAILEFGENCD